MNWIEIGRFLLIAGIVLAAIGCLFLVVDKIPLGKLPGDINVGKNNFRIHIPVTTCILLSIIILSLIHI